MNFNKLINSNEFLKSVFVVSLFIIFFISAIAYKHISNIAESTDLITRSLKVKLEFETLVSNLKDVETEHRGFIITGNKIFKSNFLKSKFKVFVNLSNLDQITKESSQQQKRLFSLKKMIVSRFSSLSKIFESNIVQTTKTNDVNYWYLDDKNTISVIQLKVNQMIKIEEALLNERQQESSDKLAFTPLFLYIILLITIVFLVLAYYKITNDFQKIQKNNQQLTIFEATTKQAEILGKFGSWTYNVNENISQYSDNFYGILGQDPKSFVGSNKNFMKFVHPEDKEIVRNSIKKIIDNEYFSSVLFRIIENNGNIKNLKIFGKLFVNTKGTKMVLGITQDATDEVKNLAILTDRNKLLERSNQELVSFNHIASHDLQEPLRKIQTFISRFRDLKNDTISENELIYLQKIESSATRMRVLIDDLLQYSRLNKAEKVFEKIDLNHVIISLENELSQLIEDENIQFSYQKLPDITGIRFQINQLFLNLILNAIKYKKPNSSPKIAIVSEIVTTDSDSRILNPDYNRFYKITVSDNGIGFEPQYAEKIFTLFNRLHNKDDYPGTGIGLSICRKAVENHNGYIFANSTINNGAVFTIYLPIS